MPNFLLEIGTEELPPDFIKPALHTLADALSISLRENNLPFEVIKTFGTPRRLTVFINELPAKQEDQTKEIMGPRDTACFDPEGKPTQALSGFANRYHIKPADIKFKDTPKGKIACALLKIKGASTKTLLPGLVVQAIRQVSSPKAMWWSDKTFSFSRPIRYFAALLGKDTLKIELAGIPSSNKTYGHSLLKPQPIILRSADLNQYKQTLKKAFVMVDMTERRTKVLAEINALLKQYDSQIPERHMDLLEEVTNMVEWPAAIEGNFSKDFLSLPEAVLAVAMKKYQRYFPVYDKEGNLLPSFIVLANNTQSNSKIIREGHERVLRARLTDAKFFWEKDKQINWTNKTNQLKEISFLPGLGSLTEKVQRLKFLTSIITSEVNYDQEIKTTTLRAAELCKLDLLSEMVGEFPELQGIMGYEYMRLQKEPEEVARAIKEHYQPRFQSDTLPQTKTGIVLALAEKFDNLAACFTLGMKPSGSQDPYALRRQTLGIIKIILENQLTLSLKKVIRLALDQVRGPNLALTDKNKTLPKNIEEALNEIKDFIEDRVYQLCLEEGFPQDLIRATLHSGFDNLPDFKTRLESIAKLKDAAIWPELVTVVERTYNIGKNVDLRGEVKSELLQTPEETELWKIYESYKPQVQQLLGQKKYYAASLLYAKAFTKPVHQFFDKVFVNVDDMSLRNNRILMMKQINQLYTERIADLSFVSLPVTP
jgi:glycyl-tRNA synthetase beta chain